MPAVLNALLTLLFIVAQLLLAKRKKTKKDAHKWWYMPWFALAYIVLCFVFYGMINNTNAPGPASPVIFQVEMIFFFLCYIIWNILRPILRAFSDALLQSYRKHFAKDSENPDKALPFPYFLDEKNQLRVRVGVTFYRWTLKLLALLVTLVYVVFIVLVPMAHVKFYLLSAFAMVGLIPLIEYYLYLSADVTTEGEQESEKKVQSPSNFDALWKEYIHVFDNYSVAWKKPGESPENVAKWEHDNNEEIDTLLKGSHGNLSDIIIENYDLATAFVKLEPLFNSVEKNGRYVLIALDIPKYFIQSQTQSYVDEIACQLCKLMKKDFFVYNERHTKETLNNSVVIASLPMLTRQGMNEEWMKKIGLITVINVFDKGVSNMYECRKFCYILESMNEDYQVVFLTPYRRGMEPSIRNSWITGSNVIEKKMRQFAVAERRYYIGYHFEEFVYRRNLILKSMTSEPIYSGSELFPIALSSTIDHTAKTVTPIHNLELSYTNAIGGKEELSKFNDQIVDRYSVSKSDINHNTRCHLLPVVQIDDNQVFAIIYDQENNAPAVYSKWMHLGRKENFTIVVSKPYLFRDYFNANHDFFVSTPLAALQPKLGKSRVTLAIILFNMLQKAEMEERDLRGLLDGYFDDKDLVSVSAIIRQLFTTYFSNNLADMLMTTDVVEFDGEKYLHKTIYRLDFTDDFSLPYLDVVSVEDESGNVLFDILRDLMDQNFAVNQMHSFSGKPYLITSFNERNKTLMVSSVNNSNADVCFYKPMQRVFLRGSRSTIEGMDALIKFNHPVTNAELSLCFEGFETEVEVRVDEWFTFHKYCSMGASSSHQKACDPPRVYRSGKVLKVSLSFLKKKEYLIRIDDIRKSLQILFYEAMQSLFPNQAQYLIISSLGEGDPELPWIFNRFDCDDQPQEGVLTYYFIEDAHVDLGLIGALADKENLWYLFRVLFDYLSWLTEGQQMTPAGYDAYLNSHHFDKFRFLKYGKEQIPSYFDVDLLLNFISDFYEKGEELHHEVGNRQGQHEFLGFCDFCGRSMKNSEMRRLSDGRMRCVECSQGAVDTPKQFDTLYEDAKRLFRSHFGIDFSRIPHHGELTSAVELHRLSGDPFSITNGYDVRKLIGLTCSREEEVFYVEDGYKPDKTFGIIVHELTHVWQNYDRDFWALRAANPDWNEGLAVWTDLFLSEKYGIDVKGKKEMWLARNDEYGRGLRLVLNTCPTNPYWYIKLHARK